MAKTTKTLLDPHREMAQITAEMAKIRQKWPKQREKLTDPHRDRGGNRLFDRAVLLACGMLVKAALERRLMNHQLGANACPAK